MTHDRIKDTVPGVDTPAADDILTYCAGGCGRVMVAQHPSHIRGGARRDEKTGEMEEFGPLSAEEVEAAVAEIEAGGTRSCLSCGPVTT